MLYILHFYNFYTPTENIICLVELKEGLALFFQLHGPALRRIDVSNL